MIKIRTINTEFELKEKIYENLKLNLSLEQKAFYLGKGAKIYYNLDPKTSDIRNFDFEENYQFLKKSLLDKNKKNILISLGCGNSAREKYFLKRCQEENIILDYYGVESSMAMIELSFENLTDINQNIQLIYGDFADKQFKEKINNIINTNSKKIFVFFGTLANIPQNYILNTLSNILNKNDLLWLDVFGKKKVNNNDANKFFKQRLKYLKNDEKFLFYPLKVLNIPLKNGKINLEMIKEKPMNSLLFKSTFKFEKDTVCQVENEEMRFLKGSSISLIEIRKYDFDSLVENFTKYNFKIFNQTIIDERFRVVFKKK